MKNFPVVFIMQMKISYFYEGDEIHRIFLNYIHTELEGFLFIFFFPMKYVPMVLLYIDDTSIPILLYLYISFSLLTVVCTNIYIVYENDSKKKEAQIFQQ